MIVNRYRLELNGGGSWAEPDPKGAWVLHDDAEAAVAAAVAAERERWKERAIAACNSAGDGPDNGCCPTYWEEAREACIAAIQKA